MFGEDSPCECEHFQGVSTSIPSQYHLKLPSHCHKCLHRNYDACAAELQPKSKSLDEAKIQPPLDFMSPAASPSGISERGFTSISFPCSPHVFESPTSGNKPNLHHFLSEGDDRWRDWEPKQIHSFDRESFGREYDAFSPSGYQSSESYQVGINPISPRKQLPKTSFNKKFSFFSLFF